MRTRVGVLSWHSNSSCSLLIFLSLVPVRFFCFLFESSRTARHVLVRALPNFFHSYPLYSLSDVGHAGRGRVSCGGEVLLQKIAYQIGHGSCPIFF